MNTFLFDLKRALQTWNTDFNKRSNVIRCLHFIVLFNGVRYDFEYYG